MRVRDTIISCPDYDSYLGFLLPSWFPPVCSQCSHGCDPRTALSGHVPPLLSPFHGSPFLMRKSSNPFCDEDAQPGPHPVSVHAHLLRFSVLSRLPRCTGPIVLRDRGTPATCGRLQGPFCLPPGMLFQWVATGLAQGPFVRQASWPHCLPTPFSQFSAALPLLISSLAIYTI